MQRNGKHESYKQASFEVERRMLEGAYDMRRSDKCDGAGRKSLTGKCGERKVYSMIADQ